MIAGAEVGTANNAQEGRENDRVDGGQGGTRGKSGQHLAGSNRELFEKMR